MAQSPLGEQFHEVAALARMRLEQFAPQGDFEERLAAARQAGVLDERQEPFLRECLHLDDLVESGQATPEVLDYERASRLQLWCQNARQAQAGR